MKPFDKRQQAECSEGFSTYRGAPIFRMNFKKVAINNSRRKTVRKLFCLSEIPQFFRLFFGRGFVPYDSLIFATQLRHTKECPIFFRSEIVSPHMQQAGVSLFGLKIIDVSSI
jgi:hypothetical protein